MYENNENNEIRALRMSENSKQRNLIYKISIYKYSIQKGHFFIRIAFCLSVCLDQPVHRCMFYLVIGLNRILYTYMFYGMIFIIVLAGAPVNTTINTN